jgi:hypothetical protein
MDQDAMKIMTAFRTIATSVGSVFQELANN